MGHLIINSHKHTEHTAWANQYQALRVRTPRRFFECIFLHFKCRCRQYILRKLDAALLISIKFNAKNIIITLINLIFLWRHLHLKYKKLHSKNCLYIERDKKWGTVVTEPIVPHSTWLNVSWGIDVSECVWVCACE